MKAVLTFLFLIGCGTQSNQNQSTLQSKSTQQVETMVFSTSDHELDRYLSEFRKALREEAHFDAPGQIEDYKTQTRSIVRKGMKYVFTLSFSQSRKNDHNRTAGTGGFRLVRERTFKLLEIQRGFHGK